ncbi:MAG: hypothetical protein IKT16_05590, partial [Desulfovibrio sp.]|nr:hypothetical protein [Desulfovibrio sp.]
RPAPCLGRLHRPSRPGKAWEPAPSPGALCLPSAELCQPAGHATPQEHMPNAFADIDSLVATGKHSW